MTDWSNFLELTEDEQCHFLLDLAVEAWESQSGFKEVKQKVDMYLKLAERILDGNYEILPRLIVFLEDPEMKSDFGSFFELVKGDKNTVAALDLASYACGFISRVAAEKTSFQPLPDAIIEAVAEVYPYFEGQSNLLNL